MKKDESYDLADAQRELIKGFWKDNPVFIAALGLCPAMAVTNSLLNALVMAVATAFVLCGASALVSLSRKWIPKQVRISIFIIIIATFVTTVDYVLQAIAPAAHKDAGAFIALIVVNCLILGRQEAFASKRPFGLAMVDAVGMSVGFGIALVMIGAMREILGNGTLLKDTPWMFSIFGPHYEPWAVMILPPGGFLCLGALLAWFAWMKERFERKEQPEAAVTAG